MPASCSKFLSKALDVGVLDELAVASGAACASRDACAASAFCAGAGAGAAVNFGDAFGTVGAGGAGGGGLVLNDSILGIAATGTGLTSGDVVFSSLSGKADTRNLSLDFAFAALYSCLYTAMLECSSITYAAAESE